MSTIEERLCDDISYYFDNNDVIEEVHLELRTRARVGEAKYGCTMDRTDLSIEEWKQHLKEEMLDALVYATKLERLVENKAIVKRFKRETLSYLELLYENRLF